VAQRFIDAVSQPIHIRAAGITVKVGASAGVAHVSDGVPEAAAFLKNADTALYAAKTGGGNRVKVFVAHEEYA
jgi:GGDEF domain-containing protein